MSLRVLIIDAEEPFANMLQAMLTRSGYETQVVNRAQDGLDLLSDQAFELVLLSLIHILTLPTILRV